MSVLADKPKYFPEVLAETSKSEMREGVGIWTGQYFNDFFIILVVRLSNSQNLIFVFNEFCKRLLPQIFHTSKLAQEKFVFELIQIQVFESHARLRQIP